MKSDLSKFRMPKKDPLESKERVTVNKNLNKTPLSSMVESAPKIPRSQTTTNKEGVNPKNMDNTSKFLGETTPTPPNNTSKFLGETTTKPLSLEERYLGETTPTTSDNTSKFLGETTPTKFDNNQSFLGETTPNKFDNNENFLGLTTPTLSNRESRFLGETTPNSADNTSKFLGETTPNSADNTSKFLGETTPNSADNTSKFLGETTQTPSNNTSKFLGETTQAPSNNTSKFLGETTPKDVNYITDIHAKGFNSKFGATLPANSKFTGVAKNQEVWNNNSIHGELKAVNFFPIETSKARGFSLNQVHRDETKFTGIKRGLNEITADDKDAFNENSSLYSKLKAVDFFPIEASKARGFSLNQFQLAPSQFTGVSKDQTKWSTTSSEYSSFSKYTHVNLSTVKSFGSNPSGTKQINNKNNTYYLDSFQAGNFAVDLTKGKLPDETKWSTDLSEYSSFSKYMHPNLSTVKAFGGNPTGKKQRNNKNNTYYLDSFQTGNFASDLTKGKLPDESKWVSNLSEYSNYSSYIHPDLSSAPGYGKFKNNFKSSGKKQSYNQDSTYYMDSFQRGDIPLDLTKGKISKLQEMRNSPSFLDEMYSKFNLRDDAHNTGMTAFDHPLILRGIQRKGKRGTEPQNFGIPGTSIDLDDGLIRGGIITSTVRAVIDTIRLGKWMVSIKGLLWGVKQFGLQQSNPNVEKIGGIRRTKLWTPINTLASALGQHIGFHPNRHGFTPFDKNDGGYELVQRSKRVGHTLGQIPLTSRIGGNRLAGLWSDSFFTVEDVTSSSNFKGFPFLRLGGIGGPNSVYGLIPGGKSPTRNEDTRYDLFIGNTIQSQYGQYYSGNAPRSTTSNDILGIKLILGDSLDLDKNFRDKTELAKKYKDKKEDYTNFKPERNPTEDPNEDSSDKTGNAAAGAIYSNKKTYEEYVTPPGSAGQYTYSDLDYYKALLNDDTAGTKVNLTNSKTHTSYGNPFNNGLSKLDANGTQEYPASEVIKDYETIAYGKIPKRVAGITGDIDFRSLLSADSNEYKRAEKENYGDKNINTYMNFGNPGKLGTGEDRVDFGNLDKKKGGTASGINDRYDKINALDIQKDGQTDLLDMIQLYFEPESGGHPIRFRGTVKGITETFSPSWDSIKYNGRADQAYKYTSFERSLSFNFQAYATSRIEMKPMWKKLEYLSTMTMPQYGGDAGYQGTLVKFQLGDLYNNKLSFIESLSYTMSDETPWDLNLDRKNPLGELPMGVDISIGLKILGKVRPKLGVTGIYDWNAKTFA